MTYLPAGDRYDRMAYRRCGRSGLELPAVSLGLWQNFGHERPLETGRAIVRRALDLLALAWTLRDPRVTSALVGASSVEQLEANVHSLDRLDFAPEELTEIDRYAVEAGINIWSASSRE